MRPLSVALLKPLLLGGVAIASLTGCQPVWVENRTPDRTFASARQECTDGAQFGVFGAGIVGYMNYRAYLDRCTAGHGYRQVDPRDVTAGQATYGPT